MPIKTMEQKKAEDNKILKLNSLTAAKQAKNPLELSSEQNGDFKNQKKRTLLYFVIITKLNQSNKWLIILATP